MANDLTKVIPRILAQGLLALRNANVMPRLVNSDYGRNAAQKGSTVEVPLPASIAVRDVAPGATPVAAPDITPDNAIITLDKWKEAPFRLTDKDMMEAMNGTIPMQVSSAIASIADQVNADIFALYKEIYGYVGTAGTTPFGSNTSEATAARKTLTNQKAPMNPRYFVIDPDAEANALDLRAFQDASFSGSAAAIQEGQINRKLGFMWVSDQQVPTHTTGGGSGWLVNDAAVAIGDTTVPIDTGSGDPVEGDVFLVAGDTQTYVVESYASNTITFSPAAKVAWADNAAITFKASHVSNLAFHRDAFAFASRPLADSANGLGSLIQSAVDPVSGISLRLEVSRQHKQTNWSFDVLYGAKTIRPELATRVAG